MEGCADPSQASHGPEVHHEPKVGHERAPGAGLQEYQLHDELCPQGSIRSWIRQQESVRDMRLSPKALERMLDKILTLKVVGGRRIFSLAGRDGVYVQVP